MSLESGDKKQPGKLRNQKHKTSCCFLGHPITRVLEKHTDSQEGYTYRLTKVFDRQDTPRQTQTDRQTHKCAKQTCRLTRVLNRQTRLTRVLYRETDAQER